MLTCSLLQFPVLIFPFFRPLGCSRRVLNIQPSYITRTTAMANWDDLPPELRLMIWKILAGDVRKSKNLRQHRRTGYATVCRQWQAYFDRFNLRQLVLSPACIPYLNEYVPQYKRPMVQRIWLRVEMPPYYCTPCCGFVMEEDSDEVWLIVMAWSFSR